MDDFRDAIYFNGYFNKRKIEYRINITEQVQGYIRGDNKVNSFYLMPAEGVLNYQSSADYKIPGRVVLNSGNNTNPSYLRIIYAKSVL
jgi:hypothetical protein